MMKKTVRIIAFALCIVMTLSVATSLVTAATAQITGTNKITSADIKINGTDTGIDLTQMILTQGSSYAKGHQGLLNVIEIAPKDPNVTMAVLNGGSYTWSRATVGNSIAAYNTAHSDATVLAAVNADPWIVYHTDYDGDGKAATGPAVKHVSVSRGLQIIDGEIWATRQCNNENKLAKEDNVERGTPSAQGPTFAVLKDGSFIIGKPNFRIQIKNTTTNSSALSSDGINRLPAPDSIIIYNQRVGTESMAYDDAYEVYLECENGSAFTVGGDVVGKVTHIFEGGDKTARPAIGPKTVILSARGTAISRLSGKFSVGNTVTVTCSVYSDTMGNAQKDSWKNVTDAVSGFFTLLEKGNETGQPGNTTKYPCSIIGLKQDGTAVMLSTTPDKDGTRSACNMEDLPDMCKELGIYTAILFDGGGSTTMVTLTGEQYVRRSSAVDGANSVRGVINTLAVVYKGVDKSYTNAETKNTAFLPDANLPSTPDIETEAPDEGGADLAGEPSYAYRYMASIDKINGKDYQALQGMRDPAYDKTWTAEQKLASIQPGKADDVIVGEDRKISLNGWALVNGGQQNHYWSVDKNNWFKCEAEFSAAEDAVLQSAATNGALTSTHAENGRFVNLTVDLSAYKGETVNVYFAVEAGTSEKLCHYLTIENVAVPGDASAETDAPVVEGTDAPVVEGTDAPVVEGTDAPVVEGTDAPVVEGTDAPVVEGTDASAGEETEADVATDADVADTSADEDGTDAPAAESKAPDAGTSAPDAETEAPTEDGGCGSVVATGSIAMLLLAGCALTVLRKKHED